MKLWVQDQKMQNVVLKAFFLSLNLYVAQGRICYVIKKTESEEDY
jgi:hypothetical protein